MKRPFRKKTILALERDLDGFVHSRFGFIAKDAYERLCERYPDSGFPKYDDIPLMTNKETAAATR